MESRVGVREFRENLSHYIAEAGKGEAVTIVSRGKPVATLTAPVQRVAVRPIPRFGTMKDKIVLHEGWDRWTEEELAAFEKSFP